MLNELILMVNTKIFLTYKVYIQRNINYIFLKGFSVSKTFCEIHNYNPYLAIYCVANSFQNLKYSCNTCKQFTHVSYRVHIFKIQFGQILHLKIHILSNSNTQCITCFFLFKYSFSWSSTI